MIAGLAPLKEAGWGKPGTAVLLAPDGARFWRVLTASPEWRDGRPDPVDRWSARILTIVAASWGGQVALPSDGPPYPPFQRWATESGRSRVSPVGMLVHDVMGLWASFRGAVLLDRTCPEPPAARSPCETCLEKPCLDSCPASALGEGGYDLAACHAWLDGKQGADCMIGGCLARRACPVGRGYGRLPEQSAYHMRQFHK